MHTVQYHAHTFYGGNESGNANEQQRKSQGTPTSVDTRQCDEKSDEKTTNNPANAKTTSKDHTRTIAVADSPAYEIGMCLATQGPFDSGENVAEGRRMGCVFKSMEERIAFLGREVQLTRSAVDDVNGDDAVDFVSIRLDGD